MIDYEKLKGFFNDTRPGITDKLHCDGKVLIFCDGFMFLVLNKETLPISGVPASNGALSRDIVSLLGDIQSELDNIKSNTYYPVPITPRVFSVLNLFPDFKAVIIMSKAPNAVAPIYAWTGEAYRFIGVAKPCSSTKIPEVPKADMKYALDTKDAKDTKDAVVDLLDLL